MKKLFLTGVLFSSLITVYAQKNPFKPQFNMGFGLGIDYGGIGGRLTVSPVKQVFLLGALGYNVAGAGYNVGAGFRFSTGHRFTPYVLGMYGYNTVVMVLVDGEYREEHTKAFTGASFGLGFEQRRSSESKNFWNFELLVPLRSKDFKDYKSGLEEKYGATFISIPVAISIGYHIGF